jgi:4-hydroxythreonine-4-phosphate dehydrogenase
VPDEKPIIAITMGDAAGIGPEVIAKALKLPEIFDICRPIVIGDAILFQKSLRLVGNESSLRSLKAPSEAAGRYGMVDILDLHNLDELQVRVGQICAPCGKAAVEYILKAARLALAREVSAVVTAPINKEATRQAGYEELGHLELLAQLTGAREYATMLCSGPLRIVHLTTHYSLQKALAYVTRERILARLILTHNSFASWGMPGPIIAVAALNPHGGEGGILGDEEIREIAPAVRAAQEQGINAHGPFPADSVFPRAIQGEFQAVIALYHDQGHIPIKVYGFEKSVSLALGLPFLRTSVDHGTAFDIAGRGVAQSVSMQEAIKLAARLSSHKGLD